MAWIVQSIIAYWIVGGCYCRYVDKIGSNTILLLSTIPYHWIGTMGRCQVWCTRSMLAPVLNVSFLTDAFAGREGQTPPFIGQAHAAPALAKNTLLLNNFSNFCPLSTFDS